MLHLRPDACPNIGIGISLHTAACSSKTGKIILLRLRVTLKLKPPCFQHCLFINYFRTNTLQGSFLKNDPAEFFYCFRTTVFQHFRWVCDALRLVLGCHLLQSNCCVSHDRIVAICIVGGIIYKSLCLRS